MNTYTTNLDIKLERYNHNGDWIGTLTYETTPCIVEAENTTQANVLFHQAGTKRLEALYDRIYNIYGTGPHLYFKLAHD